MSSLVVLGIISAIVITLLSFISKRIEMRVLFPISFAFISIILFIISPIVGGWGGMGLGAASVSLFIASTVSLIITVLFYKISQNNAKNNNRSKSH